MCTLHYSQSAVEAVAPNGRDLFMGGMSSRASFKLAMRTLLTVPPLGKVKGNYSSWIFLKSRLRSVVQTIFAHSYSIFCAIPRLGFEDERICEPIIFEIDHE